MKLLKKMFLVLLLILVAIFIFMITPFGQSQLENIFKVTDQTFYDFKTSPRSGKPNDILAISKDSDHLALHPDREIPYDDNLIPIIEKTNNIQLIDKKDNQYEFVIRTKWMRFPDRVSVLINKDGFAIYSRALYGYSDMGKNSQYIDLWVSQLEKK